MNLRLIGSLVVILSVLWACDDMNSIFQDYLDQGEKIYIGKPDSVRVFPGKERVKLEWYINADPRLKECIIYWNNKSDSAIVEIQRTAPGNMKMGTILENLKEGGYVFELYTQDIYGNISLKSEKSGEVYGSSYLSKLVNRRIKQMVVTDSGLKLTWNYVENSKGVRFTYTNNAGKTVERWIEPTEQDVVIEDYKPGESYSYVTLYQPTEDCIDVFETKKATGQFPGGE